MQGKRAAHDVRPSSSPGVARASHSDAASRDVYLLLSGAFALSPCVVVFALALRARRAKPAGDGAQPPTHAMGLRFFVATEATWHVARYSASYLTSLALAFCTSCAGLA